jgi:MSHA pilin protein MshD
MSNSGERGFSLLEAVVFIVVLGIGIAGMAVLYNQLTLSSVDPLIRKQALAIANSLMEEIQLRPFTYCDPDDPLVYTETNPVTGCSAAANREAAVIGPEAGETRYADPRFDNVSDYNGFSMDPIVDANSNPVAGLAGYRVTSVTVATAGGDFPGAIPADAALLITVTVAGPANVSVSLQGYRLRYAPNSP